MDDKATRDAFGDALVAVGQENEKLVIIDCDLAAATKTNKFRDAYPERFFQFGIQEANALSAAAGLAVAGYRPFVCSFASFITGRYDQIRISIADNEAPVVVVGTHGGLAIGKDGATQMGTEDINLMRGLPNMNIIQPADYFETFAAVRFLSVFNKPVYFRLCRQPVPNVNNENYKFEFGKGVTLRLGDDLAILATGGMVYIALEVAVELAKQEINARVINFHTIKPIDKNLILKAARETAGLITLEDHNIIGGLGSAVAEIIAEASRHVAFKRLGINDAFGESADPNDLYRKHLMEKESIIEQIVDFFREIKKSASAKESVQ